MPCDQAWSGEGPKELPLEARGGRGGGLARYVLSGQGVKKLLFVDAEAELAWSWPEEVV